jgi:outer membrane protein OmpA-like peptidoglycan-associated protein
MLEGLTKLHDSQQAASHSFIVVDKDVKLQLEDRDGLVAEVYFATDESTIDVQDKAALLKVYNLYAKLLYGSSLRAKPPKVRFKFVGYADERGSEAHNLDLSRKRATAVEEYFSAFHSSPYFSRGIVAMGEAEHPQRVTTVGSPVSAQLSRYRRVDIFARPLLNKVPDRPTIVNPPDPGSRFWAIRLIDSMSLSAGPAGVSVARLEIVDMTHQMGMTFRFKAMGASLGAKVSASMDSSGWQYFTTPQSLMFKDFEGHADHIGEGVALGYGYSVDRFVLLGPMRKGAASVAVKFTGCGRGVSSGVDIEALGSVSKGIGPYPASPEYLASPPPGSQIRW